MGLLDGKVALVTGAARYPSTGRGIALRLAEEGADVAVNNRRSAKGPTDPELRKGWRGLESMQAEIEGLGRRSVALEADITSPDEVAAMFDSLIEGLGRIDILVNNAAETPLMPFLEQDEASWDSCMQANLVGPFLCAKEAARRMIEQGEGGRIINLSSRLGKVGTPTASAYSASKSALIGLGQVMALEWGVHGITVNTGCPGVIRDSGNHLPYNYFPADDEDHHWEIVRGLVQSQRDASPLGTLDDPDSIGNLVAFLASSRAHKMTGQAVNMTAGLLM